MRKAYTGTHQDASPATPFYTLRKSIREFFYLFGCSCEPRFLNLALPYRISGQH